MKEPVFKVQLKHKRSRAARNPYLKCCQNTIKHKCSGKKPWRNPYLKSS